MDGVPPDRGFIHGHSACPDNPRLLYGQWNKSVIGLRSRPLRDTIRIRSMVCRGLENLYAEKK